MYIEAPRVGYEPHWLILTLTRLRLLANEEA